MQLKRENLPNMTAKQKKQYRERLAYVRGYTRDRREWAKKLKAKEIPKHMSLQTYRDRKRGRHPGDTVDKAQSEGLQAIKDLQGLEDTEGAIGQLERLLAELKGLKRLEAKIFELFKKTA